MNDLLYEIEKYLRDEADFNRSWTDGRRGADMLHSKEYISWRLEIARQRDEWADAMAALRAIRDADKGDETRCHF